MSRSDLAAALSHVLNHTAQTAATLQDEDAAARTKLESVSSDAEKLQRTVEELMEQVERVRNSDITGGSEVRNSDMIKKL